MLILTLKHHHKSKLCLDFQILSSPVYDKVLRNITISNDTSIEKTVKIFEKKILSIEKFKAKSHRNFKEFVVPHHQDFNELISDYVTINCVWIIYKLKRQNNNR